jgi:hypothetical protein
MTNAKTQEFTKDLDYLIDKIHELVEKGCIDEAISLYDTYQEEIKTPIMMGT